MDISIKRVSKFSPSSAKPSEKRQTLCSPEMEIKKHLQFDVVPLQDITPKNVNARTHTKSLTHVNSSDKKKIRLKKNSGKMSENKNIQKILYLM